MGVERVDFYSDDEYQYALQAEEEQWRLEEMRQREEELCAQEEAAKEQLEQEAAND